MATDIKPAGYIPQGTFSGYITPQKNIERRQRLADVLAMQGMDTSPVQSPWQALARVAQAGAGAYGNYQAGQMEQARYKALGDAMRGGMSPEQMFATGDPQMMQLGQFMVEQKRLQMESDRQNAMLGAMTENQRLARIASDRAEPGKQQGAAIEAQHAGEKTLRAEAAARFLDKVKGIYANIGVAINTETNKPDFSKAREDLFGQFQGGPGGSLLGNIASATGLPSSEADRQQLETDLQSAAEDYAAATGTTPELARRYLPSLTSPDVRTAYGGLQSAVTNAQRYIDEAGGAPEPVARTTLPPPGSSPHPFQGTPKPSVDARAGEVPLPSPTKTEFDYNTWDDVQEGDTVRDESDGRIYKKINGQMVPQ